MQKTCFLALACCGWALAASAAVFTATPNQTIPDANATGWQSVQTISSFADGLTVQSVSVTLDISGGYNGDLYAYIAHDGQQAVLLNRAGKTLANPFGYTDAGLKVQFTDSAANNIHLYQSVGGSITGGAQWQPDGRAANPLTVTDKSAVTANATLSTFGANHTLANGTWTLFVADMSAGGQSKVNNWSLQITAVPEPIHAALGIFGAIFVLAGAWRSKWNKQRWSGHQAPGK